MNAEVTESTEPVAPGQWMTILGLIVAVLAPLAGFLGGSSTGAVARENAWAYGSSRASSSVGSAFSSLSSAPHRRERLRSTGAGTGCRRRGHRPDCAG